MTETERRERRIFLFGIANGAWLTLLIVLAINPWVWRRYVLWALYLGTFLVACLLATWMISKGDHSEGAPNG